TSCSARPGGWCPEPGSAHDGSSCGGPSHSGTPPGASRGNGCRAVTASAHNGTDCSHLSRMPQRSGEEARLMAQRRIGLIGCGDVSVVHVEAIEAIDGLELVGVADVDPAARERAAAELSVPTFATAEELIEQLSPDAVHVTTPHDQHVGPSLAALE